jgi:hyaluronan synthase
MHLRTGLVTEAPLRRLPARQVSTLVDSIVRVLSGSYLVIVLGLVVAYKAEFMSALRTDVAFGIYGIVVSTYLLSRFVISIFYRQAPDIGLEPHVAIISPAFNEEKIIALSLRSLLALDYPPEKLEIVAVNDGSTDNTLAALRKVEATAGGRVHVIDFAQNRGKRAAMSAGIRATSAEILVFVDSDSVLEPDALTKLVQPFGDPRIGAVCGHSGVLNVGANWLTRMQAVRYFVAFKVLKGAESLFGAVTCCSGCFSAYRRCAVTPSLDWWEKQMWLGRPSTFGDDRSLTNCVLRNWRVVYQGSAVAHTEVPDSFRVFMRQQMRWKRSWTRESVMSATFMWRKHPIAALGTYIGIALPLIAPVIVVRALLWRPLMDGAGIPMIYPVGVYAMALIYSLYYALRHPRYDSCWIYGVAFVGFYITFMLWQTYWAILTSRSGSWGTRPTTAGNGPPDSGGPPAPVAGLA